MDEQNNEFSLPSSFSPKPHPSVSQNESTSKVQLESRQSKARRKLTIPEADAKQNLEAPETVQSPQRREADTSEQLPQLSQAAITKGLNIYMPRLRDQILDPAGGSDYPIPIRPSLQKVSTSCIYFCSFSPQYQLSSAAKELLKTEHRLFTKSHSLFAGLHSQGVS